MVKVRAEVNLPLIMLYIKQDPERTHYLKMSARDQLYNVLIIVNKDILYCSHFLSIEIMLG